jgi:hypothetical protein
MSAPVTDRAGLDFGGIGPTHGSDSSNVPQHPTTPKALDGFAATTAGVNLWAVDAQGDTYDGFNETRVTGMVIVPNTSTGIIQLQCFGQRVLVNAEGAVTKKGEITLLWAISFTGTVVNATVPVPAFP